jgi:hypothetical protein
MTRLAMLSLMLFAGCTSVPCWQGPGTTSLTPEQIDSIREFQRELAAGKTVVVKDKPVARYLGSCGRLDPVTGERVD